MTADRRRAPIHRVICAAVKLNDGRILCGIRHFDKIMRDQITIGTPKGTPDKLLPGAVQGFVDNCGVFLTREEAWELAVSAGQFDPDSESYSGIRGTLFSEDVW